MNYSEEKHVATREEEQEMALRKEAARLLRDSSFRKTVAWMMALEPNYIPQNIIDSYERLVEVREENHEFNSNQYFAYFNVTTVNKVREIEVLVPSLLNMYNTADPDRFNVSSPLEVLAEVPYSRQAQRKICEEIRQRFSNTQYETAILQGKTEARDAVLKNLAEHTQAQEDFDTAFDQLFNLGHELVTIEALRKKGKVLELDDLKQFGYEGLLIATERFEPRGNRFKTFAQPWVRQKMQRAIYESKHMQTISEGMIRDSARLFDFETEYRQTHDDLPSMEDYIDGTRLGEVRIRSILELRASLCRENSLNAPIALLGRKVALIETYGDEKNPTPFMKFADLEKSLDEKKLINHLLGILPEEEREVIRMQYGLDNGEEKGLREIGEVFGHSATWVSLRRDKALKKLRHYISDRKGTW